MKNVFLIVVVYRYWVRKYLQLINGKINILNVHIIKTQIRAIQEEIMDLEVFIIVIPFPKPSCPNLSPPPPHNQLNTLYYTNTRTGRSRCMLRSMINKKRKKKEVLGIKS